VLSRNRKTFAISSLVLNLFASQIGEFFLPHPVVLNVIINVALQQYTIVKNFSMLFHLAVTLWCIYKFNCQEESILLCICMPTPLYFSLYIPLSLPLSSHLFFPVLFVCHFIIFLLVHPPHSASFCTVGCLPLSKLNFYEFLYFERNGRCTFQIRDMWWHSWLRHCATSQMVADLIPHGVTVMFL